MARETSSKTIRKDKRSSFTYGLQFRGTQADQRPTHYLLIIIIIIIIIKIPMNW